MSITFNEIAQLVARFGNSVVNEEANMAAPTVGKGVIKKEKQTGTVGIVNVKAGGIGSTQFIADGGPLPSGSNLDIVQMAYHPKAIFSRLSIPRIAALTAVSKQDGVNLVKEQMQSVGEDLGRILGRSLFNTTLGSLSAGGVLVAGNNETTFTCNELSGYREGCAIEGLLDSTPVVPPAGPIPLFAVVTNINHATNTITADVFIDALHQVPCDEGVNCTTPVVTAVSPRIQGTGSTGTDAMCSLLDAASPTPAAGSLGTAGNYSDIALAGSTFTGNEFTGAIALSDMDNLSADISVRAGKPWTHLIMNSVSLQTYVNLLTAVRQFQSGDKLDSHGNIASAMYQGRPIVVDENVPNSTILYFNDKDVKLAEWRSFGPDYDGKNAAMVSDTNFVYDTQLFGLFNLRIVRRNGLGNYHA